MFKMFIAFHTFPKFVYLPASKQEKNEIYDYVQCNTTPNILTLLVPETKAAEFANSVDLDEVAHNDPPHLELHCLPSSL